jgi:hypothetical protein
MKIEVAAGYCVDGVLPAKRGVKQEAERKTRDKD